MELLHFLGVEFPILHGHQIEKMAPPSLDFQTFLHEVLLANLVVFEGLEYFGRNFDLTLSEEIAVNLAH